jgi:rhamnose transport system ATP-binding protein
MHEGRLAAEISRADATEASVMAAATGRNGNGGNGNGDGAGRAA